MEKYLTDLFVAAARTQSRLPEWLMRLYLSLFSPPLGKTIRIDMVLSLLKGHEFKDKRVLDVGCGIGDFSFILAQRGADVVGVELDAGKTSRANTLAQLAHFANLRFITGDVTVLDQMSLGQFDAIFCLALLEHIQDDIALLRQMQSMLRPGGLFVLEVPGARRRTIPQVEAEDGHMRPGYIFEDLPELLRSAGFRALKARTRDPLDLIYYWCLCSRVVPGAKARGCLFAILAPLFIPLIRLTSACVKRTGNELCFVAVKD